MNLPTGRYREFAEDVDPVVRPCEKCGGEMSHNHWVCLTGAVCRECGDCTECGPLINEREVVNEALDGYRKQRQMRKRR